MTIINVPNDYSTIQAAINAASTGDTVQIEDGTYNEHDLYINGDKVVDIESVSNDPTACIVDAQTLGRCFVDTSLPSSEGSYLKGITFKNGLVASSGGGIYISGGYLDLDNCIIDSCEASSGYGGGMYLITGFQGTISRSIIKDCTASGYGGGVYIYSAVIACILSHVTIQGCDAGVSGGGVGTNFDDVVMTDCIIDNNTSSADGAGCYFSNLDGAYDISRNKIINNTCTVASKNGGGIYWYLSTGAGKFNDNYIAGNNITQYSGGAYFISISSMAECKNNIVYNNSSISFVGLRIYNSDIPFVNLLVAGNTASGDYSIYCDGTARPSFENLTCANNAAATNGGLNNTTGDELTITNSIIYGNTGTQIVNSGTITVTYSDVQGGYTGTGNIDSDPLFCGFGGAYDYFLGYGSPARDAGDSAATVIDGSTWLDWTPDSGTIDQGYHYTLMLGGTGAIPKGYGAPIKKGSTDVTVYFQLRDTDGNDAIAVAPSTMTLAYIRDAASPVSHYVTALSSPTSAHTDYGMVEVSETLAPGLYRADFPDAAFVTGADHVQLMVHGSGIQSACIEIGLIDNTAKDLYDLLTDATYGLAQLARTGVDGDTLATLSDQLDTVDTVADGIKAKTDNLPDDPASEATATVNSANITAIKAKTDNLPSGLTKGEARTIQFQMVDSSDGYTLETGLTVAGRISKDGGSFSTLGNAVSEIGSTGTYTVTLTATEMDCDYGTIEFVASGARTKYVNFITET